MTDSLARQIVDRDIADKIDSLATDADRLAAAATDLARSLRTGGHAGGAFQLAQRATLLLQQAATLDGMREIAKLLPKDELA
ncbi:hypothetical protein OG552_10735 [Streptomyces sp. NBC_01476]|uniref:hypothetical protein n=1 Tax=Streptomyces sp. NBC_01476 TaxID=2903881 RepID=UPI002E32A97C|nr:hypothetical protein [Streptomyces sp. NBC_01476]